MTTESKGAVLRPFRADRVPLPKTPPFELPAGPLDLEIGCGVGLHPIRYAQANPERRLVAIEHTANKFASFERRLRNHPEIRNVVPVHANAISWITHCLTEASVDRLFLLYPNPRPRWTGLPFFQRLAWVLRPGGTLHFASNLAEYAEEARLRVTTEHGLRLISDQVLDPERLPEGFRPRTHFEKKYLLRGERCFDLIFEKPRA